MHGYDTKKLKKRILETIRKEKLIFFEDVYAGNCLSSATFYVHFPKGLKDYDDIDKALRLNKLSIKRGLRKKWYQSDAPQTQIMLYRLTSTEKELDKMVNSRLNVSGEINHVHTLKSFLDETENVGELEDSSGENSGVVHDIEEGEVIDRKEEVKK